MDEHPVEGNATSRMDTAPHPGTTPHAGTVPVSGADPLRETDPPLDRRAELSEFLRSRRARLKPEDVGLPDFGRYRRVPGLRREELAQLAGVSVAYYTRLEQGRGQGVSSEVLDAIARALRLTAAEHAHLTHLAQPRRHGKKPAVRTQQVRSSLRQLLDSLTGVPAYVMGRRLDILAWNGMATALFGDWGALPPRERNWARLVFLRPDYREMFVEWETKASDTVNQLRMDAGYHVDDAQLAALVGELSMKSDVFRRLWAAHDVKERGHGAKRIRHPVAGELTLFFETFALPDDPYQFLVTYHAEPGSPSEEVLRLIGSWGAVGLSAGED
ncbi:helix-turn-helix transcriptional regulator [Nocardiopsis sp. EMB25]|uniref:helix-turn-helix domain-containing protein n=1 Tax=Nocardiopsis TaxID=2013 RepID=UPI0003492E31|nr:MULTISPECIES: helix-turn-helix transcriptional regulator [Nocardiopsis]MCY9782449.1 helix-turn-helix transcriptional regulator [Nocardiopsis sp. EMB25]